MIYYKLVNNSNIIDVNTSEMLHYMKFSQRSNCLLLCGENEEPLGVIASDGSCAYHLIDAPPIPNNIIGTFLDVELIEISEEDYLIFKQTIDEQREMNNPPSIPEPEPVEPEPTEEERAAEEEYRQSLQFVKDNKINYLSYCCNQMIENGIDITLSDEEIHHFSLTKEDQINLMECKAQLENGDELISYHADNEICTYYSAADMLLIINTCIFHKKYHITYFNSLKHYVNSLETLEDISDVSYGIEIPIEYQSEPLKNLLEIINNNENEIN